MVAALAVDPREAHLSFNAPFIDAHKTRTSMRARERRSNCPDCLQISPADGQVQDHEKVWPVEDPARPAGRRRDARRIRVTIHLILISPGDHSMAKS